MSNVVCVDFDATCVTHEYPDMGDDAPNAVEVLRRLEANDVKLILWTMRDGKELQDAVDWYKRKGIRLFGVNSNPQQSDWTTSPKAYAQIYIDDAGINCPLVCPLNGKRPFVDWQAVERLLEEKNLL